MPVVVLVGHDCPLCGRASSQPEYPHCQPTQRPIEAGAAAAVRTIKRRTDALESAGIRAGYKCFQRRRAKVKERLFSGRKKMDLFSEIHFLMLGAGNETRTRDPDLGKVVLYQLSYSRVLVMRIL